METPKANKKVNPATKVKHDQKAHFMKLVLENKDVLLGKLTGDLTHEKQRDKWAEIRDIAIANGYTKLSGKSANYVRYTTFSQFKTRTVQKYDKLKQTGAGGNKLNEAENLLLEIVGRDSAQINGLDVEELGVPTLNEDFQSTSAPTQRSTQERATSIPGERTPLKRPNKEKLDNLIKAAKLEIMKEQVIGQRLDNRKKELEIFEIEARIGARQTVLLDELRSRIENGHTIITSIHMFASGIDSPMDETR
uniref:Regulatory protein zeste n=1 Tax=Acrobeloides nanus TaxID=290746 RepID=A0A914CNF3_9BILA